ncbi:MAG: hypothetical protein DMF67_15520 [Acidobacteria bacterium]|nr:MAG: hypothetical protein DMF67_15520 [Acidobacteriota bacterium]
MSALISSLAGRLREIIGDRRRGARRGARAQARLPFTVVLLDAQEEAAGVLTGKRSLAGHTRDLSETGLTLLLPAVRIGDGYLTDRDCYLGIRLALPGGPVSMLATSVRFEHLDIAESGYGYLVGVRVIRMREDERASYLAYLRTLAAEERRARRRRRDDAAAAVAPAAPVAGQVNAWAGITPAQVSDAFERFLREGARPRES